MCSSCGQSNSTRRNTVQQNNIRVQAYQNRLNTINEQPQTPTQAQFNNEQQQARLRDMQQRKNQNRTIYNQKYNR